MIFRTKSGSVYVVDLAKKTITGGIFNYKTVSYIEIEQSLIGQRLKVKLDDGSSLDTSPIVACQLDI
jgi:hypothetical protein